jgi:uncharacterized protein (UPF0264 family)
MAGLLISVTNADEAELALAGGADVIDVKQPRRGALGAPSPRSLAAVSHVVGGRVPLSVALGELSESVDRLSLLKTTGLVFAKVGLAQVGADWREQWTSLAAQYPASVHSVAVAYADHGRARSPCPRDVLGMTERLECKALLIDTYVKCDRGLLDFMSLSELHDLVGQAQESGLLAVLAGSLDRVSISRVLDVGPDYVAVRGAACRGGRQGRLDLQRVRGLAGTVHAGQGSSVDRAVTGSVIDLWARQQRASKGLSG